MADIEEIIRRLHISDPVEQAIARAGAQRISTLDAIARENAINAAILDKSPAVRAAAILGLEMNEEAAAAAVPPPPPEVPDEVRALFERIDAHFSPPKSNPEAKE